MSEGSIPVSREPERGESGTVSNKKGAKVESKTDTMSKSDPAPPSRVAPFIPDCAVCLQSCIHPVELPCHHVFCFLCMKGASTQYRRCALCRQEIPQDFFSSPKLLYLQEEERAEEEEVEEARTAVAKESEESYTWFYEGRNGWWEYEERTKAELEDSYRANKRTFELLIAGYVYVIDLDSMLQYRRSDPSRRRRIKRDLVSAPKKGIAGLKIKVKREENSVARQVDGAEEEKDSGGAVGGAAPPLTNSRALQSKTVKPENETLSSGDSGKKGTDSPESSSNPNINLGNSISDETVYEVMRNSSPHQTTDQSPASYSYNTSSPANTSPPVYTMPSRPRRRPANESPTNPDSQSGRDSPGTSADPPPYDPSASPSLPVLHQRTHSAPETRSVGRPRFPAPQAPPRVQASAAQSSEQQAGTAMGSAVSGTSQEPINPTHLESSVNVRSTTQTRQRQTRRRVHEV
ncbi:uncharacterized protein [Diadema antillarum]|uniref:uncharacterized protein n=1 Tax=Diadema antillarum TaxID=105358 RepID=UPI003A898323